MPPTPDLLTKEEAAKALHVSVPVLERLVRQKRIRQVRLGHRTVRFDPADLARAVEAMKEEEPGQQ